MNFLKQSRRIVKHLPLRITLLQLDTTGLSDIHCRIKESLLIKDLKPLNENVGSEKVFLY